VQAKVYNLAGEEVDKIELDDAVFGIRPNMAVVHQAVVRQQANARQGTHDTKTRAEVRGGGAKPWRQKGTGRARQGSIRSPQWRHGGVVFGPHPRSYEQDMPRKMRRLAMRSVLSAKAAAGRLVVVDSFADLEPRTKVMKQVLDNLKIDGTALIMTPGHEPNVEMAAANLPYVRTMMAYLLSVVDMLRHDYLILPRASVDVIHSILSYTGGRRKRLIKGSTLARIRANGAGATAPALPAGAKEEAETETVAFRPTGEVAAAAAATIADTATIEADTETEDRVLSPTTSSAEAGAETVASKARKKARSVRSAKAADSTKAQAEAGVEAKAAEGSGEAAPPKQEAQETREEEGQA
jgi:large subunit ribosomal protein L4